MQPTRRPSPLNPPSANAPGNVAASSRGWQAVLLRRSRRFWLGLAALYAFTWVGGWISHQRNLSEHTRQLHEQARAHHVELAAFSKSHRIPMPLERTTFDKGYHAKVNWCFPVLPGLLIADSEYAIGPLHGRGGLSIIVFYGFGSFQFGPFGGWIS
jgi:hypothetical protein